MFLTLKIGPGHITVRKQTLRWAGECTKIRTSRPKNKKISGKLQTPPYLVRRMPLHN